MPSAIMKKAPIVMSNFQKNPTSIIEDHICTNDSKTANTKRAVQIIAPPFISLSLRPQHRLLFSKEAASYGCLFPLFARCSSPSTAMSASPSEIAVAKHATAQGATSKLFTKNLDIQRLTR
jgi:hypothetical protein